MAVTAGVLLYVYRDKKVEILIVHSRGDNNKSAAWSIPKGGVEQGESHEEGARRELEEETGLIAPDLLYSLGEIPYKNNKVLHIYAGEYICSVVPWCPSPLEVDEVRFIDIEEGQNLLHPTQQEFVIRLKSRINYELGKVVQAS